jgi:hypothetical protein
MNDAIPVKRHRDSYQSRSLTEIGGVVDLERLTPGTVIAANGWEWMRLVSHEGWVHINGTIRSHEEFLEYLRAFHADGRPVTLIHMGAM